MNNRRVRIHFEYKSGGKFYASKSHGPFEYIQVTFDEVWSPDHQQLIAIYDGCWYLKIGEDDRPFTDFVIYEESGKSPTDQESLEEYERAKRHFIESQMQGLLQSMCIFAKQAFKMGVSKDQIHGDIREALIEAWGEQCPKN